ncbi:hypothetical protein V6N11_010556 [Hibiscus sabdariffa]|uniref:Uncharacterized protein n=1 Tax=Hibiscus sabdariffa TaxID=183260 RepID=A0ABR2S5M1_9ROSI
MKLEPLGKITNVVKVFDERLKIISDDFQTIEYSNKTCHQFSVANEVHRMFQFKQLESIIEGAKRCEIDVELREVNQLSDRISTINI